MTAMLCDLGLLNSTPTFMLPQVCSVRMYSNLFKQISPRSAFTLHIIDIPLHLPVSEPCRLIYPCRFHFF